MSGITGIIRLGGAPVHSGEINAMLASMARRGPDRRDALCLGNVGFGQALLATTPEALVETQPWRHAHSGCVIVSDSRLDNRPQLLDALGLGERPVDQVGDGELLHAAYQHWGNDCADRLRGDFAFAIWDPRRATLFCARDIMGVRPFYFHHTPGKLFAFASDADALLALPEVPRRVNEGRIADALIAETEGLDRTSTFYLDIARLPPARTLRLESDKVTQEEYWQPLRDCPAHLPASDEEWSSALRARLTQAVHARLRGSSPVASMMSGGLDSSSIAALGQQILTQAGRGRLSTLSAINSEGECAETTAVRAVLAAFDFDASTVDLQAMGDLPAAIHAQLEDVREPFDYSMPLVSAIYAAAAKKGIRTVLDGIVADDLYTAGPLFERLARRGRLVHAWREARALHCTRGIPHPGWRACQTLLGTFAPAVLRRLWNTHRDRTQWEQLLRDSCISPAFARRANLQQRFQTYRSDMANTRLSDPSGQAQTVMKAAYITAAIERYNRVASFHGIEPRNPYLDREVIELHAWIPLRLRVRDGWPKWVLRHAMRDVLPSTVAWRRGKEHLGYLFSQRHHPSLTAAAINGARSLLPAGAIDPEKLPGADGPAASGSAAAAAVIAWARRNTIPDRISNFS